jgi:hypothetical protein
MPDYRKMYFMLFNAVTSAVEHLQNAQNEGEDTYVESEEIPLKILPTSIDEDTKAAE